MTGFIGELTGANAAKRASQQAQKAQELEMAREGQISSAADQVNSTFNDQFTSDYYDKQRQSYLDWAQPQLDQQFADAQKQLTFSLDRSGQLNSSAKSQQFAKLQQNYDENSQRLGQAADQNANTLRSNVEGARSSLLSALTATGNTAGAVNNAISQASALSQTPSYSPLGDLFSTTTSALAQQAQLDRQNALTGGALSSPYSLGLGSSGSAVSVRR